MTMRLDDKIKKMYEQISPAHNLPLQKSDVIDSGLDVVQRAYTTFFQRCKKNRQLFTDDELATDASVFVFRIFEEELQYCSSDLVTRYLFSFTPISEEVSQVGYSCYTGWFLGALMRWIQRKRDDELIFYLPTMHLEQKLHYLGARCDGLRMVVQGDVGACFGIDMISGEICVQGSVGDMACYGMKGGEVVVEGSLEGDCGEGMTGGTIIVKGDVCGNCGIGMSGGKIIVEGDVSKDCGENMKGGKIVVEGYVKGAVGHGFQDGDIFVNGKGQIWRVWKHGWYCLENKNAGHENREVTYGS